MATPTEARAAPTESAADRVAEAAEMFRLLGDATRLKIVMSCLSGPTSVNGIAARVDASPSLVSHHLRLLRAARIVRARRRGRQVFYAPRDAHVERVVADMIAHVNEPAERGEEQ